MCVWCPQTVLVWENLYTLSKWRNLWSRPRQAMLFMLPSQSTGLWSVLTLLWTVLRNTQRGITAPSIIWTLRQEWVSSHIVMKCLYQVHILPPGDCWGWLYSIFTAHTEWDQWQPRSCMEKAYRSPLHGRGYFTWANSEFIILSPLIVSISSMSLRVTKRVSRLTYLIYCLLFNVPALKMLPRGDNNNQVLQI